MKSRVKEIRLHKAEGEERKATAKSFDEANAVLFRWKYQVIYSQYDKTDFFIEWENECRYEGTFYLRQPGIEEQNLTQRVKSYLMKLKEKETPYMNSEEKKGDQNSGIHFGKLFIRIGEIMSISYLFCPEDCEHLSHNEKAQELTYIKTGKKPDHICVKYKERLLHKFSHPAIHRCKECLDEEGETE